jgi:hypothetical protein
VTRLTAALGFRVHSGWAALVAVAGPQRRPAVVDRRRVELVDRSFPGSIQPYHAAAELDLAAAEEFLKCSAKQARLLARQALRAAGDELRQRGFEVVGCGILLGSGRPATTLAATLASHALIHTAEGVFFRDALSQACEHSKLPLTGVKERELFARGAAELGITCEELHRSVAELGRPLGPPWRQDQKCAALVAWLALAAALQG